MKNLSNTLHLADNLELLKKWYKEGRKEFIDLVYNDPPFNSNKDYNILFNPETNTVEEAFKDTWSSIKYFDVLEDFKENDIKFYEFLKIFEMLIPTDSLKAYLSIMGVMYWYIYKMLKQSGSLYHHCDPNTSHYIKIILDKMFGEANFRNETTWLRTTHAGSSWKTNSMQFGRDHDSILFYTKSNIYCFNNQVKPWADEETKSKFPYDDFDGKGPYHWAMLCYYTKEKYKELEEKHEVKWPEGNKFPRYKFYLSKSKKGTTLGDSWFDIPPLESQSKERKYPTQKPEKLLERIVLSSSNEENLVADFFMGGGTTVVVASQLKRNFIGVDINHRAIQLTIERLETHKLIPKEHYHVLGIPRSSKELRDLVDQNIFGEDKNSKFALEEITTKYYLKGVQGNKKKVGDHSIDGVFSFDFRGKRYSGFVQITSSANVNHFKAFCFEVSKIPDSIGVYISFGDKITDGIKREAKQLGRIGNVDKIQILTFEDLIDNGKTFETPQDIIIAP